MGHYDEQRSADEDAAIKRREERRKKILAYIKKDIKKRSLEAVLTDIVIDAQNYRFRVPA